MMRRPFPRRPTDRVRSHVPSGVFRRMARAKKSALLLRLAGTPWWRYRTPFRGKATRVPDCRGGAVHSLCSPRPAQRSEHRLELVEPSPPPPDQAKGPVFPRLGSGPSLAHRPAASGQGLRRKAPRQQGAGLLEGGGACLTYESTQPGALLNRFKAFFPPLPGTRDARPCRLFFPPDAR